MTWGQTVSGRVLQSRCAPSTPGCLLSDINRVLLSVIVFELFGTQKPGSWPFVTSGGHIIDLTSYCSYIFTIGVMEMTLCQFETARFVNSEYEFITPVFYSRVPRGVPVGQTVTLTGHFCFCAPSSTQGRYFDVWSFRINRFLLSITGYPIYCP